MTPQIAPENWALTIKGMPFRQDPRGAAAFRRHPDVSAAVISGIMKLQATERMRISVNDAMDVHGGKGIIEGPLNYLGSLYRGVPIGITYFAETSAFGLIALLVARFGSHEVAAHQIALNFTSLVFMVPLSLGIALLTRVGQSLGAGDPVVALADDLGTWS